MRIAMQKRQTQQTNMPAGIAGIPFKEIDNPVFNEDGNVIGCISVGISLDQETKVVNVAHNITEAVENMDVTSRGSSVGLKRGEMGSERLNELRPKKFDFDKIKGGKEWEKFKASVFKQASPEARDKRMEEYKANYIKGLKNAFGEYADHIIEIIEGLPAENVVKTYYGEQEATITFFYEKQDMDAKLDILEGIWQGANEEYENETNR
jgi:hypothetical protein